MAFGKLTANKSEGKTERALAGNHAAVLVAIIDLGNQWQEPYDASKKAKWEHRAYLVWELVTKKMTGFTDRNHVIGTDILLSFNEKAKLRKWVQARTGKTFPEGHDYDIMAELGQPCLLSVVLKGDYPRIEGVSAVPDGFTVPAPLRAPVAWELDEKNLGGIPEWCPWLFGSSIPDVVRRSKELGGKEKDGTKARSTMPGTAAAGGGATGASNGSAPQTQSSDIPY